MPFDLAYSRNASSMSGSAFAQCFNKYMRRRAILILTDNCTSRAKPRANHSTLFYYFWNKLGSTFFVFVSGKPKPVKALFFIYLIYCIYFDICHYFLISFSMCQSTTIPLMRKALTRFLWYFKSAHMLTCVDWHVVGYIWDSKVSEGVAVRLLKSVAQASSSSDCIVHKGRAMESVQGVTD